MKTSKVSTEEANLIESQRDVSYGELSMLEELFNEQVKKTGVEFTDDEQRDEARFDFVQQYIEGNDNPTIRVL